MLSHPQPKVTRLSEGKFSMLWSLEGLPPKGAGTRKQLGRNTPLHSNIPKVFRGKHTEHAGRIDTKGRHLRKNMTQISMALKHWS